MKKVMDMEELVTKAIDGAQDNASDIYSRIIELYQAVYLEDSIELKVVDFFFFFFLILI